MPARPSSDPISASIPLCGLGFPSGDPDLPIGCEWNLLISPLVKRVVLVYELTDCELIQKACEGEEEAFGVLFQRYHAPIYRLLLGIVHNSEDALELTQEVFLKAYRELPRLQRSETLLAWLRRVATNLAIDYLRRKRILSFHSLEAPINDEDPTPLGGLIPDESQDVLSTVQAKELQEALYDALGRLSADHRLVVVLHHLEGISVEAVAEMLQIPVGTVKSRLARARTLLRQLLAPHI